MDTGHVKQVAAFEKLISFCNAHGAMYNPSKASQKVAALNTLLTSAQQSLEAVKTARTAHDNAVNIRAQAFADLPKFMTRIVNILASSDASGKTVEEAYFFARKFRPASRMRKPMASGEAGAGTEPPLTRSTSQLDFDAKVDNFVSFVKVVSAEPTYKPNELELQVTALNTLAASLRDKNKAVINTLVALSNARAVRNRALYQANGIHTVATGVKKYMKGLFGYQSVGYRQISGIKFWTLKVK
jgi:hypothetical protein